MVNNEMKLETVGGVTYCSGGFASGKTTYGRKVVAEALEGGKTVCVVSSFGEYNDLDCAQLTILNEINIEDFLKVHADLFVIDGVEHFIGQFRLREVVRELNSRGCSIIVISNYPIH